jgi:hypothetical protein
MESEDNTQLLNTMSEDNQTLIRPQAEVKHVNMVTESDQKRQIKAMLWKYYLQKKRTKCMLIWELLTPIIFSPDPCKKPEAKCTQQ